MDTPRYCNPEAYDLFARQMAIVETTEGLLYGALAISMHALDDLDPVRIDNELHLLSDRVRKRVHGSDAEACLAHLHAVLFEEERFEGDLRHFYDPWMSYLPTVLGTRRGLPIMLSLVYKVVADRIGMRAHGVNSPFHFLVRVKARRRWMLVDPFARGQFLTRDEAIFRIQSICGRNSLRHDLYLPPATHRDWLRRILGNLKWSFWDGGFYEDCHAMGELEGLLTRSLRE
jgi:regulator of sirC expression with transglutaminase-like and TPR domain